MWTQQPLHLCPEGNVLSFCLLLLFKSALQIIRIEFMPIWLQLTRVKGVPKLKLFSPHFIKGRESSRQDSDATTSLPQPLVMPRRLPSLYLFYLFESVNDQQNQSKLSRT